MKRIIIIAIATVIMLMTGCKEKEIVCTIMLPGDDGYVYSKPRLYSEEYMSVAQVYDEAVQMSLGDTFYLTGILFAEARFYIFDSADYVQYNRRYGSKYFSDLHHVYMHVSDVEYEEELMAYDGKRCYVKGVLDFERTIHHPHKLCSESAIIKPIEIMFDE